MKKDEKRIRDLEDLCRRQDAMILDAEARVEKAEEGVRELIKLTDAMLIAITLEYGMDVPLGKRVAIPQIDVAELTERWSLQLIKTADGKIEVEALDRERMEEVDESLG